MQHFYHNLITAILGTHNISLFFTYLFWAEIGVFLSLLLHVAQRDTTGSANRCVFSWKLLIYKNIKRLVTSFLLVFVVIRFCHSLTGLEIDDFKAFIIGFSSDKLGKLVQNKISVLKINT